MCPGGAPRPAALSRMPSVLVAARAGAGKLHGRGQQQATGRRPRSRTQLKHVAPSRVVVRLREDSVQLEDGSQG